jgi:hypothetical protein
MSFTLAAGNYTSGLEQQAALALSSLVLFDAVLTPPVLVADMKALLETAQIQPYSANGWAAFLQIVGNLSLDDTVLTLAERSIINTIRAEIDTDPQQACCGTVIPSIGLGQTSPFIFQRTGAPTFAEIGVKLQPNISCLIRSVKVTLTGAVALVTPQPFTMYFANCDVNQNSIFNKIWIEFAADPTASGNYDVTYDFLDANNVSLATYTELAQLPI